MLNAITTKRFRKDVMRMKQRGKDVEKLITAIDLLIEEKTLPQQYLDHPLRGKYIGRRECHIEPDWLLIYKLGYYSATETTEVTEEDLGVSTTSWRAFRALYPCICDLIRNFFMSLCSLWPLWQNA